MMKGRKITFCRKRKLKTTTQPTIPAEMEAIAEIRAKDKFVSDNSSWGNYYSVLVSMEAIDEIRCQMMN